MAWKPSRSSGLMFDKYDRKARKYRDEVDKLMKEWNPPTFEQLNYFSKCFYLWYLNENKRESTLSGKLKNDNFTIFCPPYYINLFKRNQAYIYKPLIKILENV